MLKDVDVDTRFCGPLKSSNLGTGPDQGQQTLGTWKARLEARCKASPATGPAELILQHASTSSGGCGTPHFRFQHSTTSKNQETCLHTSNTINSGCSHVRSNDSLGTFGQSYTQISHNEHIFCPIHRHPLRRDPRCRDSSRKTAQDSQTSHPSQPRQPLHNIPQPSIPQSHAAFARLCISSRSKCESAADDL